MRIRVFDTETTGLRPSDKVVECGYHDLVKDGSAWRTARICSAVFNVHKLGIRCHPQAQEVHGIQDSEIDAGWDYSWLDKFLTFGGNEESGPCAPDAYCAHNFAFDQKFFQPLDKPIICTLKAAKRIWPHAPSHKNGELGVWKGISDDARLHRVIPDTRVTSGLLKLMFEEGHYPEHLVNITGVTTQGRPAPGNIPSGKPLVLNFGEYKGRSMDKIPTHYLQWIVFVSNCRDDIKEAAKKELDTR